MIYLGQPYSHPEPHIQESRYEIALAVCATLHAAEYVYSPIVAWHEVARRYNLDGTYAKWKAHNHHLLARADTLYILIIPGWRESVGLAGETLFARNHSKPIFKTQILTWFPDGRPPLLHTALAGEDILGEFSNDKDTQQRGPHTGGVGQTPPR